MMTTLSNLLQPYPIERFIKENWTKRGIIIPGEYPGKFHNLFSWQKLNYLLNFHQLDLRFILNGQVLPTREPIDWIDQCQKGATLNISHVHQHVPELADLVWGIQQETGHKAIHTNIYSSWPAQQGSKCHYDSHEVFVMQIDGQKEWFVFEDTLKYPYTDTAEKSEYLTPPKEAPYIHRVLKPGDLLYIPRGHWHYAIAQEKPSLHVTLGMRCYTGRDAFRWLFQTLEASLQGEESWRQNLPLLTEGNTTGAEKEVQQLFKNLTVLLEQKQVDFSQQYAQYLSSRALRANRAPEISLPSQAGFDFFQQELDTVLRQPKFQKIKIESLEQTEYLLITPKKKVKFKGLAPNVIDILLEKLLSYESFTIREVARWLPECDLETEILPLLACLVKEGILIEDYSGAVKPNMLNQSIAKLEATVKQPSVSL